MNTPSGDQNSILVSVKKDLGIASDDEAFDPDVIRCTNSALSILNQLGVGPEGGFSITGDTETWTDFMGNNNKLELVKTYVSMKAKQFFDPPQTGPLATALDNSLKELEWRITIAAD